MDRGFTLFIAIVIMGTLMLIAASVISLAYKQSLIATAARDSQMAFYAADSGMDCAVYWDVANPSGVSAFATTTGSTIWCNKDANNPGNQWVVGGSGTSTIATITFLPDPYCATVTVAKNADGTTVIESNGFNSCSNLNPRRVERSVRATY